MPGPGIFLLLILWRNWRVFAYLCHAPHALTMGSLNDIWIYDVIPLAAAALIAACAWLIGWVLLKRLHLLDKNRAPTGLTHCLAYGLGFGILCSGVFSLGLLGCFTNRWMIAMSGLVAILGVSGIYFFFRKPSRKPRPALRDWQAAIAGLLAFAGFHAVICALAPPTDWDPLAYHLAIPKLYLRMGRISEIPWLLHSHWPHLVQTLYALPLYWRMDNVPALLHAFNCAALVAAVFFAAEEIFQDRTAAWIGAAAMAAQPIFLYFSSSAQIDGSYALFYFLGCVAVWKWSESQSRRWLIVGGLLLGFTAATKLLGLALLAASAGVVLWIVARERKPVLPAIAWFLFCSAAAVLPWYIKTYWETGNPFWPFFSSIFGEKGSAALSAFYIKSGHLKWTTLTLGALIGDDPQYLVVPAILLSGVMLSSKKRWPVFLTLLLAPAPLYGLLVFQNSAFWRYCLPFFPGIALAVGWSASCLIREGGWRKYIAILAAGIALFPLITPDENTRLFAVLSLRSPLQPEKSGRTIYLENSLDQYKFIQTLNHTLPAGSKVLLFRDVRGFYLDVDYLWGDPVNQTLIDYAKLSSPENLRKRLAELGITHVMINDALYPESPDYYSRETVSLMSEMLARYATPVYREGRQTLFRLAAGPT